MPILDFLRCHKDELGVLLNLGLLIATAILIGVGIMQALAASAQAKAANLQTQETVRPQIVILREHETLAWKDTKQRYRIKNVGPGMATNIVWSKMTDDLLVISSHSLNFLVLPRDQSTFIGDAGLVFRVTYESVMGNKLETSVKIFEEGPEHLTAIPPPNP